MTDEEILNLWKKGWNIEKIVNSIVKLKNIKDDESRRKEFNKVEKIVFKFYTNQEGSKVNIEIGDYVRSKNGSIGKVTKIEDD